MTAHISYSNRVQRKPCRESIQYNSEAPIAYTLEVPRQLLWSEQDDQEEVEGYLRIECSGLRKHISTEVIEAVRVGDEKWAS
jgi:hypothetical protein